MEISIALDQRDRQRFERACAQLPARVFRRHVGRAAGRAMTAVSRAAKRLAPKDTGDYRKSIGKKKKTYSRTQTVWVGVGPRKGKNNYSLAYLLEYGHRMVVGGSTARTSGSRVERARTAERTGTGRMVRFVPPRMHLRPAMRRNRAAVVATYTSGLRDGILTEARLV